MHGWQPCRSIVCFVSFIWNGTGSAALSLLVASALLVLVGVTALAASRRRWHHHC
jgi:hypothetical protein